jgi:hypothetical protein
MEISYKEAANEDLEQLHKLITRVFNALTNMKQRFQTFFCQEVN